MRARLRRVLALLAVAMATTGYAAWHFGFVGLGAAGLERPGELTLYGNIDMREVQLAFQESYRIEAILVDEGARVRRGEALARLDLRHLEENVRRAEAVAAMQRHVLAELVAGSRREEIREAEAQVDAAQALNERARLERDRLDYLVVNRVGSVRDKERAQADANVASAELRRTRERLALAVQGNRPEAIAAARSKLAIDEADLALARHRLADGILQAPDDGIVHNRLLQAGDMAAPDRPVMSLALMHPIWVRTYVEEPYLERVRPGAPAWVSTDSAAGRRYTGWVGFVSPVAEFTPRAVETPSVRTELVYQVRILVCDPAGALRLGMPTTVHLPAVDPDSANQGARHQDARPECPAG